MSLDNINSTKNKRASSLVDDLDDCYSQNTNKKQRIYSNGRYCQHTDCNILATFGKPGTRKKEFCLQHKRVDDINVKNTICLHPGCILRSSFGKIGTKKAEFCSQHKRIDDINVRHVTCLHPGCKKLPGFGPIDGKRREFCSQHKRKSDVNVNSHTCLYPECKILPSFAKIGSRRGEFCFKHKRIDDINVISLTCLHSGCTLLPSFGKIGTKKKEFCLQHKRKDDVNVKDPVCLHPECNMIANFAKFGSKKREFCSQHKRTNDVNVKHPSCLHPGCIKLSSYGQIGSKRAEFCLQHKRIEDIDVKHYICLHSGCTSRPYYGLIFQKRTHCAKHRQNNQYIKNNPTCQSSSCKNRPCYTNQNNNYPLRCEEHQLKDDVNVVERPCQNCHLTYFLREGNLCNDCYEYTVEKVHKAKEVNVKLLLEAHSIEFQTWDALPKDSCFRYRPDFVIDCGTFIIILEVDEHQHKSYACLCETVRMINLFQDFGGMSVVFVRYNPDSYINHLGLYQKSMAGREKRLIDTIHSLKIHPIKETLAAIYLYYDGDDGTNKIQIINYEDNIIQEQILNNVIVE